MSAFLGKIHYLLYNKIQLNEDLLEDILNFAEGKDILVEEIKAGAYRKYGYPERRALEEVIDQGNIHGWLQMKISSVEVRTAEIVTELVDNRKIDIKDIANIYYENGKKTMGSIDTGNFSPKDLFNLIYSYMLEGMPCDRVSEVVSEDENEFLWNTTTCIHREYWDKVNGKVVNFHVLRDAWINGFLSNTGYSYVRSEEGNNKITRG